ncbi:hypothetical protein KIL84_020031 [Mauremys mutica]|uniref:Uncharacterized protein n=1 Tax=Mauremys mutica TaxID=74926 RepID=A0A9D3XWE1_9SAUR|nr:hypothetical protein KIL84_020031 [Mauremys mutica]
MQHCKYTRGKLSYKYSTRYFHCEQYQILYTTEEEFEDLSNRLLWKRSIYIRETQSISKDSTITKQKPLYKCTRRKDYISLYSTCSSIMLLVAWTTNPKYLLICWSWRESALSSFVSGYWFKDIKCCQGV